MREWRHGACDRILSGFIGLQASAIRVSTTVADATATRGFFGFVFDQTVANVDRAVGVFGHVGVVRHDDDRDPLFAIELLKQLHRFVAGVRIQRAGRFVGQAAATDC